MRLLQTYSLEDKGTTPYCWANILFSFSKKIFRQQSWKLDNGCLYTAYFFALYLLNRRKRFHLQSAICTGVATRIILVKVIDKSHYLMSCDDPKTPVSHIVDWGQLNWWSLVNIVLCCARLRGNRKKLFLFQPRFGFSAVTNNLNKISMQ